MNMVGRIIRFGNGGSGCRFVNGRAESETSMTKISADCARIFVSKELTLVFDCERNFRRKDLLSEQKVTSWGGLLHDHEEQKVVKKWLDTFFEVSRRNQNKKKIPQKTQGSFKVKDYHQNLIRSECNACRASGQMTRQTDRTKASIFGGIGHRRNLADQIHTLTSFSKCQPIEWQPTWTRSN